MLYTEIILTQYCAW